MTRLPHWIDPETGERKKPDRTSKRRCCTKCFEFFIGKTPRCPSCQRESAKQKRARNYSQKKHPLAYTHVIRNEETKELFKISLGIIDMPNGYEIVYKARHGYMLPKIYKELGEYEHQAS